VRVAAELSSVPARRSATTVRVGFHLGGARVSGAKLASGVGLLFCCTAGAVIGVTAHLARNSLGRVFSDDPAVWAAAATLSPLFGGGYAAMSVFYRYARAALCACVRRVCVCAFALRA
jgi:Na+-driven multidrug efflux pump